MKLSSNENPFGASPAALAAMEGAMHSINRYPDTDCKELGEVLAQRFFVTPSQVIVGNGSDEIITLAAGAVIGRGDIMITADTTFSVYASATKFFEGEVKRVPLNNGAFNLPEIRRRIDSRTRLICLCAPNNPTGSIFTSSELKEFMDGIDPGILVLFDQAYADYCLNADYPREIDQLIEYKNLLITRTFSKIYGLAALRVGFGIASVEIIELLKKIKTPFMVNSLAQRAAIGAINDKSFFNDSRDQNTRERAFLSTELDKRGIFYFPCEGNFLCINLNDQGETAFSYFLKRGIALRSLTSFGMQGWIRLTVGRHQDNLTFLSILDRYWEEKPC